MIRFSLCTFVAFLLIGIFASCNYERSNKNDALDPLLVKTISFPNSVLELSGNHLRKIDSFLVETKNQEKIISIIDGNCMKCIINQLNKIDSIFASIIPDDDVLMLFVLNVHKEDSASFMLNMQPAIKAKGRILWDDAYNFELENDLLTTDLNKRTFMVNKDNKVIQFGNPIISPDAVFEYKKKMK